MNYVHILQSISHPDQFCIGLCQDVTARLSSHPETTAAFERYLKSGSGRAFAHKRLR